MRHAGLIYVALGVLQRSLSLLLLPFVTRAMSVSEYGSVSVLVALGAFATAVFGTPLQAPVVRWVARNNRSRSDAEGLRAARGWLAIIGPVILTVAALITALSSDQILGVDAYLVAGEIIAAALGLHLSFYTLSSLRAQEQLRSFATVAVIFIASSIVTKVIFVVLLQFGAAGWVLSDISASLVGFIVSMVVNRHDRLSVRKRGLRALLRFTSPLLAQSLTTWSMQSLSRPVAAAVMPLSQVGIYAASLNVAGAAMMLVIEFNKSTVVHFAKSDGPLLSKNAATATRNQRLLGTAVALGLVLTTPLFVLTVLPPGYTEATTVIAILCFAPVLMALYDLPMNVLVYSAGKTRYSWVPTAAAALIQAFGLALLGPTYGSIGAAISTIMAYLFMTLVAFVLLRASRLSPPWSHYGLGVFDILLVSGTIAPLTVLIANDAPVTVKICGAAFGVAFLALIYTRDRRALRE